MPNSFAETPEGLLLIADGMDPVLKWDGLASQATTAGVIPPSTAATITFSGTHGTIQGQYFAYVRFIDSDGLPSNLSPISAGVTAPAGTDTVTYTNVPVPLESKVVRKQILRNLAGETVTFYVDVDTDQLHNQIFTSTNNDTTLATQTQVPILNSDGTLNANKYTVPPNWKAVVVPHLGRTFYLVDVEYRRGSCQVATGSNQVTGIGTEWTVSMVGRFLYVTGATQPYQISAVDTINQVLTLLTNYQDITDNFALYGIRPAPAERRLIYYSESGLPQSVPAINAVSVQEDGDELTGALTKGAFIYFLEKRHIYRFTFQNNPANDGFMFLAAQRGCINHKCAVLVEDKAYMLDELGIHAFDGGQQAEAISFAIQDIFRPSDSLYRINWRASHWFHAVHFRIQETIRWFVALGGDYLPHHALVYDYRRKRWGIEQYPYPVGASVEGSIDGVPKVFLGSEARRILSLWEGTLDVADATKGTVRGIVTASGPLSLTDSLAQFSTALAGSPVAIISGRGKNQVRIIESATSTTLSVSSPWQIKPDTTSVYQVGGVQWRFQTGDFRFLQSEETTPRRVELVYSETVQPCTFDMHIFLNFSSTPVVWNDDMTLDDGRGITRANNSTDAVIDWTKDAGFTQLRLDGHKDFYLDGPRWMNIELTGFSNVEPLSIFGITIDGCIIEG